MAKIGWLLLFAACAAAPPARESRPDAAAAGEVARRGDEIVACGRRFHTGTPVVLWRDPGGFDAYAGEGEARYGRRRGLPDGADLDDLRRVVTQVVVHYDVAVTSANCFRILHERRKLSCHFLLDVDGTVYQTLDLEERAWHAGEANDRSIGIEIANIGAYRDPGELAKWYDAGALVLPGWLPRGRLGPGPFRPARPGPISGAIHGATLFQQDYTEAQYEALARLLAALTRAFPEVRAEAPTTATVLADPAAFKGVVGHYHLTTAKVDPGPAFDWERVLKAARRYAESMP